MFVLARKNSKNENSPNMEFVGGEMRTPIKLVCRKTVHGCVARCVTPSFRHWEQQTKTELYGFASLKLAPPIITGKGKRGPDKVGQVSCSPLPVWWNGRIWGSRQQTAWRVALRLLNKWTSINERCYCNITCIEMYPTPVRAKTTSTPEIFI